MKTETDKKSTHPGNLFLTVVAIVVVILAVFYFAIYFLRDSRFEETNDAQVESHINPISARVGGFIKKVYFGEHQIVQQGDTLVTLDDREYLARLQEAQAAVDDANAQLQVLDAGIYSAQTGTSVNQDQINSAEARFVQQQADIRRYENLVKEEAATGADFDLVKSRYDVAKSELDATKNSLKTSKAKITELKSRTALLLADLKRKKATLELAQINLGYTVVTAPYTGRMGRKNILEGQQVQPGAPLVSIVNENEKWVTANFKETQVYGMYIGQTVEIQVDAIGDKTFKGKVSAISGSTGAKFSMLPPDNATGNFVKIVQRIPVKISFDETDIQDIKAGMSVNVAVSKKKS